MQSWHCLILPLDEDNEGVNSASNRCLIGCTDQSIYRSTFLPFELVWSRCCVDGERLETSDPTFPRCVPHLAAHLDKLTLEKEIIGLDITKDLESREVDITLSYVPGCPRMPQCKGRKSFSILTENSWVTAKGNLVQESQVWKTLREVINKKNGYFTVRPPPAWPQAFVKNLGLFSYWIWFLDTQNTFYLMVKGLKMHI